MSEFVQGQRWVVDAEPELGLGIVVAVEGRSVSLFFPLGDCERRYALDNAPLTRIVFQVDETVRTLEGQVLTVHQVHEQGGLKIYEVDEGALLVETQLSPEIQLNQPFMRLMTGQIDRRRWFNFRRELDDAMARLWQSRLNGMLGVRASLIPHQLYVAHTATEQARVRVLLADEVGLGKTIEAGMILNRLLLLERVQRALVVVPSALQVQWLVELVRRFNIAPVLYDEADHDFQSGQIHIIPHYALSLEQEELAQAEFDIAIVDEAHHIQLETKEFDALSALAAQCEHLVLMSATPEQLGFDSHFARLQLLDPDKYSSADALKAEEAGYASLNTLIRALPDSRAELCKRFDLDPSLDEQTLLAHVLDCHGVGRVMYRNARAAVAGFPKRLPEAHPIESDDAIARYEWLAQFLRSKPEEKVLVITHARDDVAECEQFLWDAHGIDAAVFHEEMNLIERDRAAAYFADMEQGTRVLLCSEIGSEGRNFQFSHHLVCLDLPEHPDLLEQRIGRLDRIGQTQDVHIHVPVAPGSENAQRWHWFNEVLDCVAQQNPAAGAVHDAHFSGDFSEIDAALETKVRSEVARLSTQIREGRDALLEMNSCRQPQADALAEQVREFESHTPLSLLEEAADLFNFHFEELGGGRYSLIPADNMMIDALPGIPPEGVELTFDRALANAREDLLFMAWDAPFIVGLWELLHSSELGSACVALLPTRQLPPGKCLLEASFDIAIQSDQAANCRPFLETFSLRTIAIDLAEKDLSAALPEAQLLKSLQKVDKKLARQIIKSQKDALPALYKKAEGFAEEKKSAVLQNAIDSAQKYFSAERERLKTLAEKNPAVDQADLDHLAHRESRVMQALQASSTIQLSAVRLIVTNTP